MFFLFSVIATLPLALFIMDPASWSWLPWLSFALFIFGSWILIPRRRLLMTIPLCAYVGSLTGLLLLVEVQWIAWMLLLCVGGGAWMWWRIATLHHEKTLLMRQTLMMVTFIFIYGIVHSVGALSIFLSTSILLTTLLVFIASFFFFGAYNALLAQSSASSLAWLTPTSILSILLTELFLATNYLPIALSMKALSVAIFLTATLDLYTRYESDTITHARSIGTAVVVLAASALLWWTTAWI